MGRSAVANPKISGSFSGISGWFSGKASILSGSFKGRTNRESHEIHEKDGAEREGFAWARRGGVPRTGTGEFSVPFAGIVRPFSFSCGKFETALGGAELHAVHTTEIIDG